jgi:CheY-like chemotaxis protein
MNSGFGRKGNEHDAKTAAGTPDSRAGPLRRTSGRRAVRLAVGITVMTVRREGDGTHTVLVVDDEAVVRDALAGLLKGQGYRVATAANGVEALAYLREQEPPALILMELDMPVMGGVELRSRMRDDPTWDSIPVIVISAREAPPEVRAELKAVAYYPKPCHLRDLMDRVHSSLHA